MQKEGKKNDRQDDKTRWELMPLDCLEDIARVYTEGAKKYGDNNWQKLENGYERYKGALLRHLYQSDNEVFDKETGCRHLAQVAWNAIAMLYLSKQSIEKHDTLVELVDQAASVIGDMKSEDDFFELNLFKSTNSSNHNGFNSDDFQSNDQQEELLHRFIEQEEKSVYHVDRKEVGQDTMESGSDVDVSSTDTKGHKS